MNGLPLNFKTDDVAKADIVIAHIMQEPPDNKTLVTDETIYGWVGVADPEKIGVDLSPKEWQEVGFWKLRFRARIQHELMVELGRDFIRERGKGFRLLNPGEVVPVAEKTLMESLAAALKKFDFKASNVRESDLTMREANERRAAVARMGSISAVVSYAEKEKKKSEERRQMKSTESNPPAIPTPVVEPTEEDTPGIV